MRTNRQHLKEAMVTLLQELDKEFSPLTLKRFLKKGGGKWRRFRQCLKDAQDPEEYKLKVDHLQQLQQLQQLQALGEKGAFDLNYNLMLRTNCDYASQSSFCCAEKQGS